MNRTMKTFAIFLVVLLCLCFAAAAEADNLVNDEWIISPSSAMASETVDIELNLENFEDIPWNDLDHITLEVTLDFPGFRYEKEMEWEPGRAYTQIAFDAAENYHLHPVFWKKDNSRYESEEIEDYVLQVTSVGRLDGPALEIGPFLPAGEDVTFTIGAVENAQEYDVIFQDCTEDHGWASWEEHWQAVPEQETYTLTVPRGTLDPWHRYWVYACAKAVNYDSGRSETFLTVTDGETPGVSLNVRDEEIFRAQTEIEMFINAPDANFVRIFSRDGQCWDFWAAGEGGFMNQRECLWLNSGEYDLIALSYNGNPDAEEFNRDDMSAYDDCSNTVSLKVTSDGRAAMPEIELDEDEIKRGESVTGRIFPGDGVSDAETFWYDIKIQEQDGREFYNNRMVHTGPEPFDFTIPVTTMLEERKTYFVRVWTGYIGVDGEMDDGTASFTVVNSAGDDRLTVFPEPHCIDEEFEIGVNLVSGNVCGLYCEIRKDNEYYDNWWPDFFEYGCAALGRYVFREPGNYSVRLRLLDVEEELGGTWHDYLEPLYFDIGSMGVLEDPVFELPETVDAGELMMVSFRGDENAECYEMRIFDIKDDGREVFFTRVDSEEGQTDYALTIPADTMRPYRNYVIEIKACASGYEPGVFTRSVVIHNEQVKEINLTTDHQYEVMAHEQIRFHISAPGATHIRLIEKNQGWNDIWLEDWMDPADLEWSWEFEGPFAEVYAIAYYGEIDDQFDPDRAYDEGLFIGVSNMQYFEVSNIGRLPRAEIELERTAIARGEPLNVTVTPGEGTPDGVELWYDLKIRNDEWNELFNYRVYHTGSDPFEFTFPTGMLPEGSKWRIVVWCGGLNYIGNEDQFQCPEFTVLNEKVNNCMTLSATSANTQDMIRITLSLTNPDLYADGARIIFRKPGQEQDFDFANFYAPDDSARYFADWVAEGMEIGLEFSDWRNGSAGSMSFVVCGACDYVLHPQILVNDQWIDVPDVSDSSLHIDSNGPLDPISITCEDIVNPINAFSFEFSLVNHADYYVYNIVDEEGNYLFDETIPAQEGNTRIVTVNPCTLDTERDYYIRVYAYAAGYDYAWKEKAIHTNEGYGYLDAPEMDLPDRVSAAEPLEITFGAVENAENYDLQIYDVYDDWQEVFKTNIDARENQEDYTVIVPAGILRPYRGYVAELSSYASGWVSGNGRQSFMTVSGELHEIGLSTDHPYEATAHEQISFHISAPGATHIRLIEKNQGWNDIWLEDWMDPADLEWSWEFEGPFAEVYAIAYYGEIDDQFDPNRMYDEGLFTGISNMLGFNIKNDGRIPLPELELDKSVVKRGENLNVKITPSMDIPADTDIWYDIKIRHNGDEWDEPFCYRVTHQGTDPIYFPLPTEKLYDGSWRVVVWTAAEGHLGNEDDESAPSFTVEGELPVEPGITLTKTTVETLESTYAIVCLPEYEDREEDVQLVFYGNQFDITIFDFRDGNLAAHIPVEFHSWADQTYDVYLLVRDDTGEFVDAGVPHQTLTVYATKKLDPLNLEMAPQRVTEKVSPDICFTLPEYYDYAALQIFIFREDGEELDWLYETFLDEQPGSIRFPWPEEIALEAGRTYLVHVRVGGKRGYDMETEEVIFPVVPEVTFTLPASLRTIDEEAFKGIDARCIRIPSGVQTIGSGAFANCNNLLAIYIPVSVEKISDNAFDGCYWNLMIICPKGSAAEAFANAHDFYLVTE